MTEQMKATPPTHVLTRLSTMYDHFEDRLRVTAEANDGETVELWITRPLLNKLLPHFFSWLDKEVASLPHKQAIQSFQQQVARADTKPLPPVPRTEKALSWVVHTIDVTVSNRSIRLTFKSSKGDAASVSFGRIDFRKWLNIVFDVFVKAKWPTESWPEWFITQNNTEASQQLN